MEDRKAVKIYFDTEFIEYPGSIQLISIGMVKENGDEYYAISNEFSPKNANEWVKENVLSKLEPDIERKSLKSIAQDIISFVGNDTPQFWAYYADYDWVVFCWIFGTMMDLPKNFPMFCMDLKQEMVQMGLSKQWKQELCPDPEGEHNALVDAKWNKRLHYEISSAPLMSH